MPMALALRKISRLRSPNKHRRCEESDAGEAREGQKEEDVKTERGQALSPSDRSFESDFRERHPSPLRTLELAGQVRDGRSWKINGELHWDSVKMDSPRPAAAGGASAERSREGAVVTSRY